MLKTFSIILLIVILYFSLIKPTFAVSPYDESYTDPYNAFTTVYGSIQRDFAMRVARYVANSNYSVNNIKNLRNRIVSGGYYCYFYYDSQTAYNNASPLNKGNVYFIAVQKAYVTSQSVTNNDWYGISSITQYQVNFSNENYRYYFSSNNSLTQNTITDSCVMPFEYVNYIDPYVAWYFSNVIDADGKVNSSLNDLLVQVANINSHTENIEGDMEDIKDFLSNNNANDSSFNRTPISTPSSDTDANVDSIFYSLETAFTSSASANVELPIPFTNNTIIIPNNLVRSRLSHLGDGFLLTIVQLFWWWFLGRFIIKDILNYLDKLQSGEIISHSDDNIKADLL